ncbi:putative DNA-binding protein [Virgibacillus sp. W0181]|uniref:putative DNA-binding protein n=1 Tax=Virgibacillus sp. W0181 TaxID=3391581 RepID=UPI003F45A9F5
MLLEKTNRMNYLFDFYEKLLTSKQKEYMELYYIEDYSLGEISEVSEVSRQAVYDNIKRTEQILEAYEKNLHLYEKFQQRLEIINKLEKRASHENVDERMLEWIEQLKELG